MSRKVFFVACEASGDAHGAHLIREILNLDPDIEIQGIGGPRMRDAGMNLREDMTRISALGFGDVVRQYFKYRRIFYQTIRSVRQWRPDAVVTIDSPAFNLRLAKKISADFPLLYYISPQIWAWAGNRIHTIKKHVKKMLVILPFEVSLYEKADVPCEFVGHPLLDQIQMSRSRESIREELSLAPGRLGIGLFPGSRKKEVQRIFPLMLESARLLHEKMPNTTFYYSRSPNVVREIYDGCLPPYGSLPLRKPEMDFHELIHAMDFALVASGTATLESALLGTPFFLLYKTSWSTYFLGKHLIRVPYLGLVNLLAGKRVIPEFIQQEAKPVTIAHEAEVLLKNPELYEEIKKEFRLVRDRLGPEGAGRRAAESVLNFIRRYPRD